MPCSQPLVALSCKQSVGKRYRTGVNEGKHPTYSKITWNLVKNKVDGSCDDCSSTFKWVRTIIFIRQGMNSKCRFKTMDQKLQLLHDFILHLYEHSMLTSNPCMYIIRVHTISFFFILGWKGSTFFSRTRATGTWA